MEDLISVAQINNEKGGKLENFLLNEQNFILLNEECSDDNKLSK